MRSAFRNAFALVALCVALLVAVPARALTYTVLESGTYTGALPKVTGSLTWAAGSYGIVAVAAAVTAGGSITVSAVTGGAESWAERGLIAYSSRRATAALVSDDTPSNGTLSITLTHSNSFAEMLYYVIQVTDVDDSGGSPFGTGDEIVQGGGTAVTSSGVGTVNANDNSFVVVGLEDGTGLQAQTDTTEIAKITSGSSTRQLFIGYSTTDGSPGAQWTGTNGAGLVAMMIQGVAGGAPTLSSATPSGTLGTSTTATIGATTTDSTGTTFYAVVDTAANLDGVSAAQVKAGQNETGAAAVASCNAAVSTTTPSCGVTGLTAATGYTRRAVHTNGTGDSNIDTGTFTTAAASSALLLRRRRH